MRRCAVILAVLFAAALPAAASGLVEVLRDSGATVHSLGAVAGLEGYWVEPQGGAGYPLYVTASGHGVLGLLHDSQGRLLTADQIAAADLERASPSLGAAIDRAAFAIGSDGPDIVVLADPACSWSRSTVAHLAMAALEGSLVLHVVPVALLGETSARMALAVVSAGDPVEAWFSGSQATGAPEAAAGIAANNRLFSDLGGRAVPFVLRATRDGFEGHEGAIDDPLMWLEEGSP